MKREVPTICRVCEAACGLVAEVDGERVVALRPDPEHPLSRGFACVKGTRFHEVHHHPARVRRPLVRASRDALFAERSWEAALAHIGARLRAIREAHGPGAVGLFSGNSAGRSLGGVLGVEAFRRAFATDKSYSTLTLDNAPMYVAVEACLGNPMATLVGDFEGADLVVLLGTDPLASSASQCQSHPRIGDALRARAREGALVVVDPRASVTARAASTHLAPRLGGDAALLAWLVREVVAARRAVLATDALLDPEDLADLARAVAPFDRARAEEATGLSADALAALRERLLAARRPLVWSGLGVLLGPDGTVGYWLTLALQAALGGLDRRGGWLLSTAAFDLPAVARRAGLRAHEPDRPSRIRGLPATMGTAPAATLADDVLTEGPDRLRALVVVGGNPAISLPDTRRAERALRALDLLVVLDLHVSDTAAHGHAVLPVSSWLARDDFPVHLAPTKRLPHLQRAPAVVAPVGEARDDWDVLLDLCRASGRPAFGSRAADAFLRATRIHANDAGALAVRLFSPLSYGALKAAPRGLVAPGEALGALRRRGTDLPGGRVRLAPPAFVAALQGALGLAAPAEVTDRVRLQLLTSARPVETMNSWTHVVRGAARRAPVARVSPSDLARVPLDDGAVGRLRSVANGESLEVTVVADPGLRPGVVVLPFGWGHHPEAVGAGEGASRGVNANVLVGTTHLEAFTGQPASNGQWVELGAARSDLP